ncbi:hypothetical protein SARU107417_07485 [Salinibacter ruber]
MPSGTMNANAAHCRATWWAASAVVPSVPIITVVTMKRLDSTPRDAPIGAPTHTSSRRYAASGSRRRVNTS